MGGWVGGWVGLHILQSLYGKIGLIFKGGLGLHILQSLFVWHNWFDFKA